ncbi:MAG: hypothetical protein FWC89_14095, partial [Defluviitaleaceae bacterium]|nr:hypothetical protein [Defluviitaleaceae bacterium]
SLTSRRTLCGIRLPLTNILTFLGGGSDVGIVDKDSINITTSTITTAEMIAMFNMACFFILLSSS